MLDKLTRFNLFTNSANALPSNELVFTLAKNGSTYTHKGGSLLHSNFVVVRHAP